MRPIWTQDLDCVIWTPGVCFIGGGSHSEKQQSQQGPVANPAFPMLQGNVQRATSIADMPFQPYTGQIVAPSNPSLDSSWGMFSNIGANNIGAPTLNAGIDATKGVAGYQPWNVNAPSISAGTLPGTDLSGYMNPYQKNVTDTTMANLERQRQIARVSDNQSATGANAFGGARQGVADSLTNDAYDRNAAKTLADLNFGNFNNAQGMATGDLNRIFSASVANQNAALSAGQSNQNAGIAGAGLRLNAGSQLGAMSDQELQQALSRAGAVNQAGTQQRSIQQQMQDAAYQEFLRQLAYPTQGQDLINRAMGLLPGGISQQGTSSGKSSGWNFSFNPFGGGGGGGANS